MASNNTSTSFRKSAIDNIRMRTILTIEANSAVLTFREKKFQTSLGLTKLECNGGNTHIGEKLK